MIGSLRRSTAGRARARRRDRACPRAPRSPFTNTLTWRRILPCSSSTQPSRRGYRRSSSRSTSPRESPGRSCCPCPSARSLSGARSITTAIAGSLGRADDSRTCGSLPRARRLAARRIQLSLEIVAEQSRRSRPAPAPHAGAATRPGPRPDARRPRPRRSSASRQRAAPIQRQPQLQLEPVRAPLADRQLVSGERDRGEAARLRDHGPRRQQADAVSLRPGVGCDRGSAARPGRRRPTPPAPRAAIGANSARKFGEASVSSANASMPLRAPLVVPVRAPGLGDQQRRGRTELRRRTVRRDPRIASARSARPSVSPRRRRTHDSKILAYTASSVRSPRGSEPRLDLPADREDLVPPTQIEQRLQLTHPRHLRQPREPVRLGGELRVQPHLERCGRSVAEPQLEGVVRAGQRERLSQPGLLSQPDRLPQVVEPSLVAQLASGRAAELQRPHVSRRGDPVASPARASSPPTPDIRRCGRP